MGWYHHALGSVPSGHCWVIMFGKWPGGRILHSSRESLNKRQCNHGLQSSFHSQLNFSSGLNTLLMRSCVAETFYTFRPWVFQVNLRLSPQEEISVTISAGMGLWLVMVRERVAEYPPPLQDWQLDAILLAVISKALPVLRVMFQSLGVWSMLSSPTNQSEPSVSSALKTRTVPLGSGMPRPLALLFLSYILLLAFRLVWEQPPALMVMRLYFLTVTLQTLGMNYTCFCELSLRETGSLRVYMWQSENDFSENEGALSAMAIMGAATVLNIMTGCGVFCTVFTSPAISFSLAFWYLFPDRLSMDTQPPISALFSSQFSVTEQSDFQEKPVVLQATSQLVVMVWLLNTFQLRVGRVKKPSGREGKWMPSMLFSTYMPLLVLRMYPELQPRRVPLSLQLLSPNLVQIYTSLLIYFSRMALVLTRFPSQFCQKTRMLSVLLSALKVTVSVWMLDETSVKQRSLLPLSKEMERTSFTIANWSLQMVTARETASLMEEADRHVLSTSAMRTV